MNLTKEQKIELDQLAAKATETFTQFIACFQTLIEIGIETNKVIQSARPCFAPGGIVSDNGYHAELIAVDDMIVKGETVIPKWPSNKQTFLETLKRDVEKCRTDKYKGLTQEELLNMAKEFDRKNAEQKTEREALINSIIDKTDEIIDDQLKVKVNPERMKKKVGRPAAEKKIKEKYTKEEKVDDREVVPGRRIPDQNGRSVLYLRKNEKICARKECKNVFKSKDINTVFCSIRCESMEKDKKVFTTVEKTEK
jgi:hypothetical protein